jgi:hypothetical protein
MSHENQSVSQKDTVGSNLALSANESPTFAEKITERR